MGMARSNPLRHHLSLGQGQGSIARRQRFDKIANLGFEIGVSLNASCMGAGRLGLFADLELCSQLSQGHF